MFEGYKVVFVEDDLPVRVSLTQTLELEGLAVVPCRSAEEALPHVQPGAQVIVITDVRLPGMDGRALLAHVQATDPQIPVILITAHGDVNMAVQAMRNGAYDFIEKPFAPERLLDTARRALDLRLIRHSADELRAQLSAASGIEAALLGKSAAMQQLRRQVLNLASTSADVMILGETGTGKELVARCLHDQSPRRDRNFVAINCGGLPEALFESELFGHESGAFTSAGKRRIGKIEHANGGTLLLDEIETMPVALQIKLLRVLQERRVERLGSNEEQVINVRFIAASKADLKEMGERGQFRERPLLPAQHRHAGAAAAARAPRGHPAAVRALRRPGLQALRARCARTHAREAARAHGPRLAGQCARDPQRGRPLRAGPR